MQYSYLRYSDIKLTIDILKKRVILIFCYSSLVFIFITINACVDNNILDITHIEEGKEIETKINLQVTQSTYPKLRSQTNAESSITQIQILVFENSVYKYKVVGKNVTSTGSNVSFNTLLHSTSSPIDIFILANSDNIISNNPPIVGDSKSVVVAKLNGAFTTSGISSNFPMFGIYSSSSGINSLISNTISGISMLRHVARIDIDASSTTNFTLASIQAFRVNNLGQIIPNNMVSNAAATSPSIPSGSTITINTSAITVIGNTSTSQLYLNESVAPVLANQTSSATCIVIGGYYNGSNTISYYRLDFNPGISGHPFGQILRNYIYKFTLLNIANQGYSTASLAASNASKGAVFQVKTWNSNTSNMVFNMTNYFGVSSNPIKVASTASSSTSIDVDTDVSSYTMQWANAAGIASGSPSTSLNNGTISIQQQNGGSKLLITSLTTNSSGANVTQYVLITANNLTMLLTINQSTFGISPASIVISASGGLGYAIVKSTSTWAGISSQTWFTPTTATQDTLKWTAIQNSSSNARTGNMVLTNHAGDQINVPFQQNGQNTTTLNIYSLRSGYAYLGATSSVSTAETRAQGLKGIITNSSNFGSAGSVNLGGFNFTESTTNPHTLTDAVLANINILYMSLPGSVTEVSTSGATAAVNWLNADSKRVMIVFFGINTCANILNALGVGGINYYVINGTGFPLQYNSNTTYFTSTGPFATYPYNTIPTGFSFRRYDGNFAEMSIASNPTVTPILLGPYNDILLGIDKTRRIVYVGDVDIFNNSTGGNYPTTDNFLQNNTGLVNSNAAKLIANTWAWITQTALGITP